MAAPDTPKRPLPYSHQRAQSHTFAHPLASATPDIKLPTIPAKGKQKEIEDFHFGWWDFVPLLEPRRPPVQWTSSSLILTAHATEPRVACLHFPSNKHFTLPNPHHISTSPASYEPPTIISASSRDNWIFAYFPGIEVDGVGCFWTRSRRVDDWSVKEFWTFARGDGIVAARWLNPDREWSSFGPEAPLRLPSLGPFIPSHPVLFSVTETHLCDVFYLHPQNGKIHRISTSLRRRSASKEGQKRPFGEQVEGSRTSERCVHAAIGLGYDESSVLVSMYSDSIPSSGPESPEENSTGINMPLALPSSEEPDITCKWESWRDEGIINICEVDIFVEGFSLSLATNPLPPIRDLAQSDRCLTSMTFAPCLPPTGQALPSTPTQTHRRVTPQSSPASGPVHASQSPGRSTLRSPVKIAAPKPILEKAKGKAHGPLYLLCTTLEHGHFAAAPTSEITVYYFWRNPTNPQTWYSRRLSQLVLPSSVVVYMSPFQPNNIPQHTSALIAILNRKGQATRRKGQQCLTVGKLQVLRIPELQFDDGWESLNLVCPVDARGIEFPFSFAVSPNRTLVCAIPAAPLMSFNANASAFIHQHPSRATQAGSESVAWQKPIRQLAAYAETTLQRRFEPNDIVHILCTQNVPLVIIEDALSAALLDFESDHAGVASIRTNEAIGLAIEIYRRRSLAAKSDTEISDLTTRYQTGLEICSLSACSLVWEDTFSSNGYDPVAIWNLTALCVYFMEDLLENLLKECVQFASELSLSEVLGGNGDDAGPLDPLINTFAGNQSGQAALIHLRSSLLHLVHPYTLDIFHSFVQHVRRFRGFVGSKARADEHLQVAREILIDCIDSSPIDIEALDRVLSEVKPEVKANAERFPDISRRTLVSLKPPGQYLSLSRKIVSKLMQVQVADKLALFIKHTDLVDGMLGLSLGSSGKTRDRDVITKGYLTGQNQMRQCLRCSGKSEISCNGAQGHVSDRWAVWERLWLMHCVCGGLWSSGARQNLA